MDELLNTILTQINGKIMIEGYFIDSLAVVYVVFKMLDPKDKESWMSPAFMDSQTGQWYSANDLNQIINN